MSDVTCYACDNEPEYLLHKGWEPRPVCQEHAELLKEIGMDMEGKV